MLLIVVIYFACALLLTIYGINAHVLIHLYKRRYPRRRFLDQRVLDTFYGKRPPYDANSGAAVKLPTVTTQVPVFNELNVAERIIDAVAALQYPAGRHEIQVLDDSTDESYDLISNKIRLLRRQGIDIHHIRRNDRSGFKAGALHYGLECARGDFVAIFDADFMPPPDFLLRSMPFFLTDSRLGIVQGRWGHLNETESWITRLQALGIDGHFMIEQGARSTSRLWMNFNGTAGVLRKAAIVDAGGWQADTLTEDMDLSYRLQLRGWHSHYIVDLVAPAEIPSDLNGFKSQQFRWAKGSIQTAIKLMPSIWRSNQNAFVKLQATLHLTHYLIHPLMLLIAVLAPFLMLIKSPFLTGIGLIGFGILLLLSCTGPSRMYLVAGRTLGRPSIKTILLLPLMVCFGCGLAVNNSRAIIEALLGISSAFVRTPKNGLIRKKTYRISRSPLIVLELLTGVWCLFGVGLYFNSQHYLIGHFMLIYAVGFLSIGGLSWWHSHDNATR